MQRNSIHNPAHVENAQTQNPFPTSGDNFTTVACLDDVIDPMALLGSTAPDWLEPVIKATTGQNVKHRGITHYVVVWVAALAFALLLWDFHGLLAAFCWGGLTHVLADSMTVSGVPFAPHSDRRFHLFGGRLRTGESGEYAVAWGIVAVCAVAMQLVHTSGNWYPFFYDWPGLYEEGIIDGKEWKDNRFRFF